MKTLLKNQNYVINTSAHKYIYIYIQERKMVNFPSILVNQPEGQKLKKLLYLLCNNTSDYYEKNNHQAATRKDILYQL